MYKSRDNLSPSCSSSEELVAYLYDEMSAVERSAFETHLGDCDVCTAEFAGLSFARLDVYEWHRDEFLEMPTPRIVIPYGEAVKVSWFDAVRAFFASPAQWATAGGAFAVLAIAAGVWFMAPKTADVARSGPSSSPVAAIDTRAKENQVIKTPVSDDEAATSDSKVVQPVSPPNEPKVVKVAADKNVKTQNVRPAKIEKNIPQPVRNVRPAVAPRLNDFEDEDDNTLRLGDLLAEVDTRD